MNRQLTIILLLFLAIGGCDDPDKPGKTDTSGIDTIDNTLYGTTNYYAIGFNFASAEKVSSLARPAPDLMIELGGSLDPFILQTGAGLNGFWLQGEYGDETAAKQAFINLKAPVVSGWEDWANPVKPHQVWVYRSADEHYVKIRIVSTFSEVRTPRNYAECTFEWVYQPDGSLTFPGK